jgi:hypothetical protein
MSTVSSRLPFLSADSGIGTKVATTSSLLQTNETISDLDQASSVLQLFTEIIIYCYIQNTIR